MLLVINYRKTYRILTIGLSYKVVAGFPGSLLQSGRGLSYKVVVDKRSHPKALGESVRRGGQLPCGH